MPINCGSREGQVKASDTHQARTGAQRPGVLGGEPAENATKGCALDRSSEAELRRPVPEPPPACFGAAGVVVLDAIADALDRIDTALLRANPKLLVGFSDITALHALLVREGLVGVHAPMPGSNLVQEGNDDDAQALFDALMHPLLDGHRFAPALADGHWRVPGQAEGVLVGGNLSLVAALLGTPWAWPSEGTILFLEDVSESLYRVDRLLTQLRLAGVLERTRGFVLGSFTEDADPAAVLREHLAALGKPVLAGWPAGHSTPNRELPLGAAVTLDATAGTLTLRQTLWR